MNRELECEIADHTRSMETIARVRSSIRLVERWTSEKKLADGEHFRLACKAMAALGQPDEINPHRNSDGERVKVGPYVSQAVTYVLHGVDCTSSDRELVQQHAMLINVAARQG
jgi:hypothetical protein